MELGWRSKGPEFGDICWGAQGDCLSTVVSGTTRVTTWVVGVINPFINLHTKSSGSCSLALGVGMVGFYVLWDVVLGQVLLSLLASFTPLVGLT